MPSCHSRGSSRSWEQPTQAKTEALQAVLAGPRRINSNMNMNMSGGGPEWSMMMLVVCVSAGSLCVCLCVVIVYNLHTSTSYLSGGGPEWSMMMLVVGVLLKVCVCWSVLGGRGVISLYLDVVHVWLWARMVNDDASWNSVCLGLREVGLCYVISPTCKSYMSSSGPEWSMMFVVCVPAGSLCLEVCLEGRDVC